MPVDRQCSKLGRCSSGGLHQLGEEEEVVRAQKGHKKSSRLNDY